MRRIWSFSMVKFLKEVSSSYLFLRNNSFSPDIFSILVFASFVSPSWVVSSWWILSSKDLMLAWRSMTCTSLSEILSLRSLTSLFLVLTNSSIFESKSAVCFTMFSFRAPMVAFKLSFFVINSSISSLCFSSTSLDSLLKLASLISRSEDNSSSSSVLFLNSSLRNSISESLLLTSSFRRSIWLSLVSNEPFSLFISTSNSIFCFWTWRSHSTLLLPSWSFKYWFWFLASSIFNSIDLISSSIHFSFFLRASLWFCSWCSICLHNSSTLLFLFLISFSSDTSSSSFTLRSFTTSTISLISSSNSPFNLSSCFSISFFFQFKLSIFSSFSNILSCSFLSSLFTEAISFSWFNAWVSFSTLISWILLFDASDAWRIWSVSSFFTVFNSSLSSLIWFNFSVRFAISPSDSDFSFSTSL